MFRRRSFTLVEVVVAMGIMLVVASLIATASMIFFSAYDRTQRHAKALEQYLAIDNVFDNCVRNLVPFKWTDSDGTERFVFEGKSDSVLFVSLRRAHGGDPGALLFLRLRLEDGELVAEYSHYPRFQWDEEGDAARPFVREVLAEKVRSVAFKYAETAGTGSTDESDGSSGEEIEWLDEWDEDQHAGVPLAIRMTVEWENGQTEYWLRRVAGMSGRSSLGVHNTAEVSQ